MEKKKGNLWTVIIVVILVIIIGGLFGSQGAGSKSIKIGYISPMSGPAAAYGDYTRKAFQLALDEWNASHTDKMQAIYEDGKCAPADAVTAANKLINVDKVNFLMTFCTGETNAVAPIAEQNKIILLTSGTTAPNIVKGKYIFRNIGSVGSGLPVLTKLAYDFNKQIALISENTDYAASTKNGFTQQYTALGGKVLFDESFDAKSLDFKTIITKLKESKVESIFVVVQSLDNSAVLFKQMKELNYHPQIFTTEGAISTKALDKYTKEGYENIVEGAVLVQPYFDRENPKAKIMISAYDTKFGTSTGPIPESYLATHYDAVSLIGEAVENVGNNSDAISNYFLTKISNWSGAIGSFGFDKTGDTIVQTQTKIVKGGNIVEYK